MINLGYLDLSGNNIAVISSLALQSLSLLVSLNLARNNIKKIDEEGFQGLKSVEEINLEDNDLNKVPTGALSQVINLNKLVIGQNPLKQISHNALIGNLRIKMLNISHCPQLSEIKAGAFKSNILLRTIVISDNPNLKSLNKVAFNKDTRIESLDLRRNRLNSLSENLLDWNYVKILQLSENLWHCDCDMKWLQQTIFNIVNNTQASVRIVKCFSPNILWDHDIVTADIQPCESVSESEQAEQKINDMPDEFDEASVVSIVTAVFATLVIVVVVFSALICIFMHCRKRSSNSASSSASDTSRGTDVSYYQVGHHIYTSPVINTKNVQNLPPQYFLRTWEESDILCQEEAYRRTLMSEKVRRCAL